LRDVGVGWALPAENGVQGESWWAMDTIRAVTRKKTRLFNPRRDRWSKHFKLHGATIVGLTPVGRTTVRTQAMNSPLAVEVRRDLIDEGQYPKEADDRN